VTIGWAPEWAPQSTRVFTPGFGGSNLTVVRKQFKAIRFVCYAADLGRHSFEIGQIEEQLVLSRGLLRCEPFGDLTRILVNGLKVEVNECNVIDGHSLGEAPYEHRARFDPASSVRLIRVSGWGIAPSLPQRDVTVKGEWLLTLRAPKALHARRLAQPPKTRWTDHTSRRGLSQSRARVLPGE
jgi:hypothetical protein